MLTRFVDTAPTAAAKYKTPIDVKKVRGGVSGYCSNGAEFMVATRCRPRCARHR